MHSLAVGLVAGKYRLVRARPNRDVALCLWCYCPSGRIVVKKMPSGFATQFGARIRKLREERGLSQEELAHAASLHRTHISLIERGQRSVRVETIEALAYALRVQPAELMPEIVLPDE